MWSATKQSMDLISASEPAVFLRDFRSAAALTPFSHTRFSKPKDYELATIVVASHNNADTPLAVRTVRIM